MPNCGFWLWTSQLPALQPDSTAVVLLHPLMQEQCQWMQAVRLTNPLPLLILLSQRAFWSSERAEGKETPSTTLANHTSRKHTEHSAPEIPLWLLKEMPVTWQSTQKRKPEAFKQIPWFKKPIWSKVIKIPCSIMQQACSASRDLVQIYSIGLYALMHI